MPKFGQWHPAPGAEGIIRRIFPPGRSMMSMMIDFQAGAIGPAHAHPHEQLTFVVTGSLRVTLDGAVHLVAAGEQLVVPGGVVHSVEALERTIAVETFTPLRDDLLATIEGDH